MIPKKIKKPKQRSMSAITDEADKLMSKYIRTKHLLYYGHLKCVSCGNIKQWDEIDCGHFISRRYFATRYLEENAHPECHYCNRFNIDHHIGYTLSMIDMYGKDKVEELQRESKRLLKPSEKRDIVEKALEYYKNALKNLGE